MEQLSGSTSLYRKLRERDPELEAIRFHADRQPLRATAGPQRHPDALRPPGHHHP